MVIKVSKWRYQKFKIIFFVVCRPCACVHGARAKLETVIENQLLGIVIIVFKRYHSTQFETAYYKVAVPSFDLNIRITTFKTVKHNCCIYDNIHK